MYYISAIFCVSLIVIDADGSGLVPLCGDTRDEEDSSEVRGRGYGYGGFGYPFLPFLEPLSILAVLGFLAFLVQTFHAIYHNHNNNNNNGLVGGLLNNVLPGHHKKIDFESRQNDNIIRAIEFYETMNRRKRSKKKRSKNRNKKSKRKQDT